jgi:alkaline phosphatase D
LKNDLLKAQQNGITWKFIMSSDPIQNFGIPVAGDRWEGYAAERTDLLRFIKENNIKNVVFATGDFHGYVVNNVTYSNPK